MMYVDSINQGTMWYVCVCVYRPVGSHKIPMALISFYSFGELE